MPCLTASETESLAGSGFCCTGSTGCSSLPLPPCRGQRIGNRSRTTSRVGSLSLSSLKRSHLNARAGGMRFRCKCACSFHVCRTVPVAASRGRIQLAVAIGQVACWPLSREDHLPEKVTVCGSFEENRAAACRHGSPRHSTKHGRSSLLANLELDLCRFAAFPKQRFASRVCRGMLLQRRAPLATTSSLPGRQFAFRRSCCPQVCSCRVPPDSVTRIVLYFYRLTSQRPGAVQAAAQMDAATCEDLAVPTTFQRLIARKTGQSFREVAEIDTVSMIKLDKGQVRVAVVGYIRRCGPRQRFDECSAQASKTTPAWRRCLSKFCMPASTADVRRFVLEASLCTSSRLMRRHQLCLGLSLAPDSVVPLDSRNSWVLWEIIPHAFAFQVLQEQES